MTEWLVHPLGVNRLSRKWIHPLGQVNGTPDIGFV